MEKKRRRRYSIYDRVARDIAYIRFRFRRMDPNKLRRDLDDLDRYAYREISNLRVKMLWHTFIIAALTGADIVMVIMLIVR